MMKRTFATLALLAMSAIAARSEDLQTYNLTLKGNQFSPAEVHVPAGKPFFLVITNQNATPSEFEMSAPPLEKVLQPGGQGRVRVRPLAKGKFKFFDDFHSSVIGYIVAE
jgi:uncharacterized cupredoxin-like copper-binding protein